MTLSVVSITHTTFSTDATSHPVDMPATVTVGDLLLLFFSNDANTAATTPSGWNVVTSTIQGSNLRGTCYIRIATGSEGGTTVDCVTAVAEQGAAQVYRIQGNLELTGAGFVEGVSANSTNAGVTTMDPPAVTASWGADNNLFISYVTTSSAATITGPSGWGTPTKTNEGSANGSNSAQVFTSILASSNASEDPGVWTLSATGVSTGQSTIVIRPKVGSVGVPVNTLAGATVATTTHALNIPAVASGRVLLITSYARRGSTTLAPDNPTISDTSGSPLTWTPVFSTPPVNVGVNPGIKAQWWWAPADGNAHNPVTLTWTNATAIFSSVADFAVPVSADFTNQIYGGNAGTGTAVTVTYPTTPSTGIHFLSFYGAGGSGSTIATGYTSLTTVASSPYRTGYDLTPIGNNSAVMGGSFPGQMLIAVNIVDGGGITVNQTTPTAMTASVGTVTVTIVDAADNIQVTGQQLSVVTMGEGGDYPTVRTSFGNPLGGSLLRNQGSTVNPYLTLYNQATVEVGDLVYVVLTEETNLTVTGITDDRGNTYTALNSGTDAGPVTGRAFYTIVTNPGTIYTVTAAVSASNDDCILLAQAFQGPFGGLDANPSNSTADITSPYDGPATGTLAQANELLVAWASRPDNISITSVSPLLICSQITAGSNMRTNISRQVLSSTTTVTPQFQSPSDPFALLAGTTTFKGAFGVSVNVTTNLITASVGTASANQDISINVTGLEVDVQVTGTTTTTRTSTGNILANMFSQYGSILNPSPTLNGSGMVEVNDLVFVTFAQESSLTAGTCSDNLGNTYTALNAGSDAGAITGRAYYTIVTNPGFLSTVQATATASSLNAIITAIALQGPYLGIDANPANSVNVDLVNPYDAPATGVLAQADELLFTWCMRPDSVNAVVVVPLLSTSSLSSGSGIRSSTGRQILTSTSSVTPQWTSASDPAQIILGTATFKINTGLTLVNLTTPTALTASVGTVTVTTTSGVSVNVTTNSVTALTNNSSVTAVQNVSTTLTTPTALTASVGNESVTTTASVSVNVTTNLITASVGGASVSAGGNISITVGGNQATVSVGTVSVNIPQTVTLTTTTALTASVGNESVGIGIAVNLTTPNALTASVRSVTAGGLTNAIVEVFGEVLYCDSAFAIARIGATASVTGQSMTVSRGTVVGAISKDVAVTGQSVTVATKVPTFITNHFITVHAPVITVSLGQAISPNWGALGPGAPVEAWTPIGSGSSETWTPVPGSVSTPNNWT